MTIDSRASPTTRPRFPFVGRIVAAMALGGLIGGMFGARVERLGEIGSVVIDLIKALAGPLLFFAIVDAFLRTQVKARGAALMVAISLTNALIAVAIGLGLSNLLQPGTHHAPPVQLRSAHTTRAVIPPGVELRPIDVLKELEGYLPKNVIKPFLDNSVISIVFLAVLAGTALRQVKNEQLREGDEGYKAVEALVAALFRATEVTLGWVITLVPLAVFGVVARTIGRDGLGPVKVLGWYLSVAVLGLAIQVLVVYQSWIVFVARAPLRWFWSGAKDALVYALGSSSSLATLPVTLRCLDRMGVSPQSARLAACVGTNLNNDGILLYEAMAVLFVAQYHGIHLTVGQQVIAASSCVIAGIGIAAVPDAGLISLALVLATVGLPVEILPLLLTVDWFLSRCRAVTNVSSDILVAVLLDRFGVGDDEPRTDIPEPVWAANDPGGI